MDAAAFLALALFMKTELPRGNVPMLTVSHGRPRDPPQILHLQILLGAPGAWGWRDLGGRPGDTWHSAIRSEPIFLKGAWESGARTRPCRGRCLCGRKARVSAFRCPTCSCNFGALLVDCRPLRAWGLPDAITEKTHDLHKRRFGRNLGVALSLVLLRAIVFGLTVAKDREGASMEADDPLARFRSLAGVEADQ